MSSGPGTVTHRLLCAPWTLSDEYLEIQAVVGDGLESYICHLRPDAAELSELIRVIKSRRWDALEKESVWKRLLLALGWYEFVDGPVGVLKSGLRGPTQWLEFQSRTDGEKVFLVLKVYDGFERMELFLDPASLVAFLRSLNEVAERRP